MLILNNSDRAHRAWFAVRAYVDHDPGSTYAQEQPETHLQDLLGDLMHYADEQGIDFTTTFHWAASNYQEELEEEK